MVQNDLVAYIHEGKRRGISRETLYKNLRGRKYSDEAILAAERTVLSQPFTQKIPETKGTSLLHKKSTLKKLQMIFIHPKELFANTKGELLFTTIVYQLLISIAPFILGAILILIFTGPVLEFFGDFVDLQGKELVAPSIGVTAIFVVVFGLSLFVILPAISLIISGMTHLFLRLYGGTGAYGDTYSAGVYSATPLLLFWFIPIVGLWSLILALFGYSGHHGISKSRVLWAILSSCLLLINSLLFFILFTVVLGG